MAGSLLYWLAVGSLVSSKCNSLRLKSGLLANLLGIGLLSIVLVKSFFIAEFDPFLRVAPFLSALGLALIASGFRGVFQYWRELLILILLAPPPTVLSEIIDTSLITARFSTTFLWYSGFNVVRDGVNILLPTGGIEVYSGCSGIENIFHLLGLSILFLTTFSVKHVYRILIPLSAVFIGFITNAIRVAIMAVLSATPRQDAFEYWHKGDGSLIFSMISVFLFGIYCFSVLQSLEENDEPII